MYRYVPGAGKGVALSAARSIAESIAVTLERSANLPFQRFQRRVDLVRSVIAVRRDADSAGAIGRDDTLLLQRAADRNAVVAGKAERDDPRRDAFAASRSNLRSEAAQSVAEPVGQLEDVLCDRVGPLRSKRPIDDTSDSAPMRFGVPASNRIASLENGCS